MIPEDSLTSEQRAALSNTICGDAQAARELEQMWIEIASELGRTIPKPQARRLALP